MQQQQAMTGCQKYIQLSSWKRLILIAGMLPSAGLLAMFAPSQAAYADAGWPQTVFICQAGHGGNGGIANNQSAGAGGAPGGGCTYGNKGGDGAPGGDHGSPGGNGGNVIL